MANNPVSFVDPDGGQWYYPSTSDLIQHYQTLRIGHTNSNGMAKDRMKKNVSTIFSSAENVALAPVPSKNDSCLHSSF